MSHPLVHFYVALDTEDSVFSFFISTVSCSRINNNNIWHLLFFSMKEFPSVLLKTPVNEHSCRFSSENTDQKKNMFPRMLISENKDSVVSVKL